MPTIDELPPAFSVSDTDEIAVSQSDVARSATRAQLLAGLQPALALPSGAVLGRVSAGVGAPEPIAIGANLAIVNGALTAPPPFVIGALASGTPPMPADLVAIGQSNQNASITLRVVPGWPERREWDRCIQFDGQRDRCRRSEEACATASRMR